KRIYEEKQREQREKQERLEKVEKANVEADSLFKGNQIDEALRKWNEVLNLDPFNKKAQEGICLAQGRLREIRACEESKFRVLRWIEEEEGRLIQLKNKMRTGFQLYQEGEFRKALDTWNELGNEK
ncbi:MAG: hypothetical protein JW774_00995, partial [Candidatus Aureabacteria bacterium]|nr:hypothetical protein [Candidatus Auribacterota bacterium]